MHIPKAFVMENVDISWCLQGKERTAAEVDGVKENKKVMLCTIDKTHLPLPQRVTT